MIKKLISGGLTVSDQAALDAAMRLGIITVVFNSQFNLKITSSHSSGTKTYTVNSGGEISFK